MLQDQFDLSGQVAIVTGGGRGIGRAIVEGLAQAGADVVPTARTEKDVEAAAAAVREYDRDALEITTDITNQDQVDNLMEQTRSELGGADIVVNNAGINPESALGRPETVDIDGYDLTLDVNLRSAFRCAQSAAEHLLESGNGSLINVASVGGLVGLPRQHPYVASKHGLVGLTKSMSLDWAPDVRVNALAPGYVRTALTEELRNNEDLKSSIANRTPLDRFAEPGEIAGPAVFLASDAAGFITGECLTADGGWTAR